MLLNNARIGCYLLLTSISCFFALSADAASRDPYEKALKSYENILRSVVVNGKVDYENLSRDRQPLENYIKILAEQDLTKLDGSRAKSLLINAYNAFTLRLILDYWPQIESIKDIPDFPVARRWQDKRWRIGKSLLSLDDILHRHLRPMGDPLIHFAIVCASTSCADLSPKVYRTERLHKQLEQAARNFLADSQKGLRIGTRDNLFGRLIPFASISQIFYLYEEDFGKTMQDRISFIYKYAPSDAQRFLSENAQRLKIEKLPYDWTLNKR